MWVVELIGWAFLGGCMVAAFCAPIYAVNWFISEGKLVDTKNE